MMKKTTRNLRKLITTSVEKVTSTLEKSFKNSNLHNSLSRDTLKITLGLKAVFRVSRLSEKVNIFQPLTVI